MDIKKTTLSGIGWVGGFRFGSRIIAFIKLAILARLLSPAEFGLYGIAFLVLMFLEIFTETGVNTVLIQEPKSINKYINSAWVISIVRGCFIALLLIAVSPLIGYLFNSPASVSLIYLTSIIPFVRGFINPSIVKLQKELNFKREFVYRIVLFAIDAIVAIIIVYLTGSVYGIIWGNIVGVIVEMIWSHIIIKPRPIFSYSLKQIHYIMSKGKWVTGTRIFDYIFGQGDDIVVGRMLGESSLGIYQAAYKISSLPVSEISDVVGKVMFPVLVKISGDNKRLARAFIKSFLICSILIVLFGLLIYSFSYQLVYVLLGKNWLQAVPITQTLTIFGIAKGVSTLFHSLFLSKGKQRYVSRMTFLSMMVMLGTLYPFITRFGLIGAAYSAIAGSLSSIPVAIYYSRSLITR